MKKTVFLIITLFFLLCFAAGASASEGSYIVKLKCGEVPGELMDVLSEINADHRLYTTDNIEVVLSYGEYIEYTEGNQTFDMIDIVPVETGEFGASIMSVNDPYYSRMWQLQSINAEYAWDVATYGNEVNVAVIDSGCYPHQDFGDALKGGCNVMAGEDKNDYSDNHGHGTHVAGIIAAQHNTIGIVGIAPKVNLYSVKITDKGTGISHATIAAAIYAAVDDFDCKVINMSLAAASNTATLYNAVKYAYGKGAIMICAAGNDGEESYGTRIMYPAGYDETISVGAVTDENKRTDFSQRNDKVFVSAPGYKYISTYKEGRYATTSGTSQATPIVASAAAIMLSANPDMTFSEFKGYIQQYSTPLEDDYTGCGLINIEAMLKAYINSKAFYVSPRNDGDVYIKNNTSENFNVVYENSDTGEKYAAKVNSGNGKNAGFLEGKGRLFFWTDYLKPLCAPKNYGE